MCGRYHSAKPPELIREWFRVLEPAPNFPPRYNAAPTQSLPVVRSNPDTGARSLDLLRWGLVPVWAKDPKIGARMINARAETVGTQPAFRSAFVKRRCIVPADGFYEWKKMPDGTKQPFAIGPDDPAEMFGFAGLWEEWKDPDGEWLRTYTIITTKANLLVGQIHDRMPVILPREAYGRWLGEERAAPEQLLELLRPYPAESVRIWPVSTRVNNVRNEGADLLNSA